jgi:SagB-type dehydrogenase family enzyme
LSKSRGKLAGPVRVRRSPHLLLYWARDTLVLRNYATSIATEATPSVCRILDVCDRWRTVAEIGRALEIANTPLLARLIRRLVARSFLQASSQAEDPREHAMRALALWNPEVGFFHTATKRVRFLSPREARRMAKDQLLETPMPSPVKGYGNVETILLPRPGAAGEAGRVARARRTWRRFGSSPVALDELATLLGVSLGVHKWVRVGRREIPLKTSPSGGARHPIEAYVFARRVAGLSSGVYHYHAGRHALERLRAIPSGVRLHSYMPASGHFIKAPVLVFFTAILGRQLWRYPYSRAYRAALIEAGHVCQTFCLLATALNLAPFSLMGLADPVIEHDLGLDGITETVLYAAGVGQRPGNNTTWAPRPRGTLPVRDNPRLRPR